MKATILFSFFLTVLNISTNSANANLVSPFPSSVPGITIPNTHAIDANEEGRILRGMAPLNKLDELIEYGITDIVIFKSQTREEVDKEIEDLDRLGFNKKNIYHFPFKWRRFESINDACRQTIGALQILKEVKENSNRSVYLHCTVGEDRTGYVAGLWRILDQGWGRSEAFKYEMCENGFAKGNPKKPSKVYRAIRGELTPLYFFMASLIKKGKLSLDNLDINVCDEKIDLVPAWSKCKNSSKL